MQTKVGDDKSSNYYSYDFIVDCNDEKSVCL